jgi:glycosyltransferase involved in cell wall biosynthesis
MRIAYICADPGVPVFGHKGSSVHVQSVIRALRRQGATVELFAMRRDGTPPSDLLDLVVHALPAPPKGDLAEREAALLRANVELAALLNRAGPFDFVYERYALWSYAGMEYAAASATPGLLEVNAPLIEEQIAHRGLVNRRQAASVARRVFASASALLAVSEGVAAYLNGYPEARGRVGVVPNGVDLERFSADLSPALPPSGVYTVGFLGTLKPWHGLGVLIDAFAALHRSHPDSRLLLVGDGPERGALEQDLAARGLRQAAQFTGAVEPNVVPWLLRAFDVAVAPYPALEHFYFSPLKVYEYMAAGLPVVVSALGQLRDLISHEHNGLLCPPGDSAALAAALARLREDAALRERLGRAARVTVERSYSWDAVAVRILASAQLCAGQVPR